MDFGRGIRRFDRQDGTNRPARLLEPLEQRTSFYATAFGSEIAVGSATSAVGFNFPRMTPSVATDAAGRVMVVWNEFRNEFDATPWRNVVFARAFNAAGVPMATAPTVLSDVTGAIGTNDPLGNRPGVAWSASAGFVVAYDSFNTSGGLDGVLLRRVALDGTASLPVTVNAAPSLYAGRPSVAAASNRVAVTWSQWLDAGSRGDILIRWFDPVTLTPTGAPSAVHDASPLIEDSSPRVSLDANGRAFVVWSSFSNGARLLARAVDPVVGGLGTPYTMNPTDAGWSADATVNPAGGFIAVTSTSAGNNQPVTTRSIPFSSSGEAGTATNIITSDRSSRPAISAGSDGRFAVVQSLGNSSTPGQLFQRMASGEPAGATSSVGLGPLEVDIAFRPDDGFWVAYDQKRASSSNPQGIRLRRFAEPDLVAPRIVGVSIDINASGGPSIQIAFSESVGTSLTASDLTLTNLSDNTTIPTSAFTLAYDARADVATLRFESIPLDSRYRVTLPAAQVTDLTGNPNVGTYSSTVGFLRGDANGDARVNFDDLLVLAANYNQSGKLFTQGDFNYDGTVNFDDLLVLAARYNTTLATSLAGASSAGAPLAVAPPAGASTSRPPGDDDDDAPPSVLA